MSLLRLNAVYDEEARVWTVSDDQLGLGAEAETVEVLEYKLKELIPAGGMFKHQGKGDYEIWFSPVSHKHFPVDANTRPDPRQCRAID